MKILRTSERLVSKSLFEPSQPVGNISPRRGGRGRFHELTSMLTDGEVVFGEWV